MSLALVYEADLQRGGPRLHAGAVLEPDTRVLQFDPRQEPSLFASPVLGAPQQVRPGLAPAKLVPNDERELLERRPFVVCTHLEKLESREGLW